MEKIIAVVGPTAAGKTSLAVSLAEKYGGEVVSCDSMQLYRNMDIGTAKPKPAETKSIPHHMIDVLDISDSYSVSDYVSDAAKVCEEVFGRGKLPVFCGGTGLYIDSFLSGVRFCEMENDESVHLRLAGEYDEYGIEPLFERLKAADPEAAARIPMCNVKRVIRALEVYETTGVGMSEWNRRSKENTHKRNAIVIGLGYSTRETLYERIDRRVDAMLSEGLLDETAKLMDMGLEKTPTAGQAIGYKEFYPYFNGQAPLEECIETLKRNSRKYAKRQMTWFRRNQDIYWIYRDGMTDGQVLEKASEQADAFLRR